MAGNYCQKLLIFLVFTFIFLFFHLVTNAQTISINSIDELQRIGRHPSYPSNGNYILAQDIDATVTVQWNNGLGFEPIGTVENPFTGRFNGNNRKITGLFINRPSQDYIGLFGVISSSNAEISNVVLEGVQIKGHLHVGGLVGFNYSGNIINCSTSGKVEGVMQVGGMVGTNYGSVGYQCFSTAHTYGSIAVGGLVGTNGNIIQDCYALAYVVGAWSAGGLVGYNLNGLVNRCYASSAVHYTDCIAGGLVGYHKDGEIRDSYSAGAVQGNVFIGGLVGYVDGGSVVNTYSVGWVQGNRAGGLIAYNRNGIGYVQDSYWDIQLSQISYSDGGEGKTSAEMKTSATYPNWDFVNIWDINEGLTYPYLRWQLELVTLGLVPNVVSQNLASARNTLENAGFTVFATYEYQEGVPAGTVITQLPYANTVVARGSQIHLTVSLGAPTYIELRTIEDIQRIGNDPGYPLNANYRLQLVDPGSSTMDASDTVNWNQGAGFVPIGTTAKPFTGRFDGNNITISKLYINRPNQNYVGLFGVIGPTAKITNLFLKEEQVVGKNYVGGVVGYNLGGSIANCRNSGSIIGEEKVGGLVGFNEGVIESCFSPCTVYGMEEVGGLVGSNFGTILRSYSTAFITASTYVGGLVGFNSGVIGQCYTAGRILYADNYVGGLAGTSFLGAVDNSYAHTLVRGKQYIGGLVGFNYDGGIVHCYSTGLVEGLDANSTRGGLVAVNVREYLYIPQQNVEQSFWDVLTSNISYSAGGIGKTTPEMIKRNTYTEWDFVNIWGIVEDTSYPYLLWQTRPVSWVDTPNVVGTAESGARAVIENAGLVVFVLTEASQTVPEGAVIRQFPFSGEDIFEGTQVTIWVSIGPGNIYISTIDELQRIGNHPSYPLNATYYLSNSIDASVTITWNDNAGFKPIGNWVNRFTGRFYGQNYTITRLYINRPDEYYVGLFGYVGEGALISGIRLEEVWVSGEEYVGGLVGFNYKGTIENCSIVYYFWDPVYGKSTVCGDNYVGGLVGCNYRASITNSYTDNIIISGTWYVGGLVGENIASLIDSCYSIARVVGYWYVGGLIGRDTNGAVTACYTSSYTEGDYFVGGLIGLTSGLLDTNYSVGQVNGNWYVGGLVGNNYMGTISNSYSHAEVAGNGDVAGLIGTNDGFVQFCYSVGFVRHYAKSISNAELVPKTEGVEKQSFNVGGLIGYSSELSTVISSYWDIQTSGQVVSAGGEGRTTDQMMSSATYLGWDFVNTWGIIEGQTYPYLIALGPTVIYIPITIPELNINFFYQIYQIGTNWDWPWWIIYNLRRNIDGSITQTLNQGRGFKPIRTFTGTFLGNNFTISNLYINRPTENRIGFVGNLGFTGRIKGLRLDNINYVGNDYVGGLVGFNYGYVEDCSVSGSIVGRDYVGGVTGYDHLYPTLIRTYTEGTIQGTQYIGGLVGYSNRGRIVYCYSTASVSGQSYVGGAVGYLTYYGSVTDSYVTGGNISGGAFVGGLVGANVEYSMVNRCYSTNLVTGATSVGGLVGITDSANVVNSYWDLQTSGQSDSSGGEGKMTYEMKQQDTYEDWDFVYVWEIVENQTYPCLKKLPCGYISTTVPDVIGQLTTEAETTLSNADLQVGTITSQCHNSIPQGRVIGQNPEPGATVPTNTVVNIIVSSGPCSKFQVNINAPSQVTANEGSTLTLSVTVEGEAGELNYQWYFSPDPYRKDAIPISGANSNTLVIQNIQPEHAGWYWCQVWDETDVVESDKVQVIVRIQGMSIVSMTIIILLVLVFIIGLLLINVHKKWGTNSISEI